MKTKRQYPYDVEALAQENTPPDRISVEQLQHLVQLLDRSDVSEVEVKRIEEGTHLVLRKVVATDGAAQGSYQVASPVEDVADTADTAENKQHAVVSQLVGIFHPWAKPRGKALVKVGDQVKAGQLVGAIQSLNVISEVETTVAGRVTEILVQDGQPVEYGQPLIMIERIEG